MTHRPKRLLALALLAATTAPAGLAAAMTALPGDPTAAPAATPAPAPTPAGLRLADSDDDKAKPFWRRAHKDDDRRRADRHRGHDDDDEEDDDDDDDDDDDGGGRGQPARPILPPPAQNPLIGAPKATVN